MQFLVTAAWKEPLPGWVDNLNGPTGILVGAGKGVIRSMHCNAELNADIVPVDIAINSIIILAHKLGTSQRKDKPLVYNVTGNRVSSYNDVSSHMFQCVCFSEQPYQLG